SSIYRVIETKTSQSGKESKLASVAYNISEQGKTILPEIKDAARLVIFGRVNVYGKDKTHPIYESYYVGSAGFFNVFSFPIVEGDLVNSWKDPHTIVLRDETAIKLFGSTNVVGKTVDVDGDSIPFKVAAVIRIPSNSHLQFNIMFSESTFMAEEQFRNEVNSDWGSNDFVSYLQLANGTDVNAFEKKLGSLVNSKRNQQQAKSEFHLQPLSAIHFYSAGLGGNPDAREGNIMHMYVFGIVALFVLLIACINYMNLTTARFAGRSKEIAVRKVAGADRQTLVKQFLSEAFLVTFIAFVLSLLLVKLVLPAFNAFADKKLELNQNTDYRIWIGLIATMLSAGLMLGLD